MAQRLIFERLALVIVSLLIALAVSPSFGNFFSYRRKGNVWLILEWGLQLTWSSSRAFVGYIIRIAASGGKLAEGQSVGCARRPWIMCRHMLTCLILLPKHLWSLVYRGWPPHSPADSHEGQKETVPSKSDGIIAIWLGNRTWTLFLCTLVL